MERKTMSEHRTPDKGPATPPAPAPAETDDYFELAYEVDEFGVHIPEYLTAR